jgi:hypothetical protein
MYKRARMLDRTFCVTDFGDYFESLFIIFFIGELSVFGTDICMRMHNNCHSLSIFYSHMVDTVLIGFYCFGDFFCVCVLWHVVFFTFYDYY